MYYDARYGWMRPLPYNQYSTVEPFYFSSFPTPFFSPQLPIMTPYPKPMPIIIPNGGNSPFMTSFKKEDGQLDFNKMMDTAGQVVSAMNQMSSLLKGVSQIFKT